MVKRSRGVGPSRVDGLVRDAVARIIEDDVDDPRLAFISITGAEVTPDHRYATVWWSSLEPSVVARDPARTGGDRVPDAGTVAAGLEAAALRIQGLLGHAVRLRNTPELRFRPDPARAAGDRVDALLRQLRDDEATGP